MMQGEDHPFVPRDLKLPGFVPPFLSDSNIVSIYGIASLLVMLFTWILSGWSPKRSKADRLLIRWWIFAGLTHIVLEVYFIFSPEFYKTTPRYLADVCKFITWIADVWKEYSKGDSRYAGRDSAVVAVEGITAVLIGPASFLAAIYASFHFVLYLIDKYPIAAKKSYRYVIQIYISLGQLYGTAVYFVTSMLDGDNFAASAYYYYAYYVFANGWWVLIATIIVIHAWK